MTDDDDGGPLQPLATFPRGVTDRLLHIRTCFVCGGGICKANKSGRCRSCNCRHVQAQVAREDYAEWGRARAAGMTSEQRKERGRAGYRAQVEGMTSEQIAERMRTLQSGLTPGQLSAAGKAAQRQLTPEQRSERMRARALERQALMTPEERSELSRLANEARWAKKRTS